MLFVDHDDEKKTQKQGKYFSGESHGKNWYPGGKLTYWGEYFLFFPKSIYPGGKSKNSCFQAKKNEGGGLYSVRRENTGVCGNNHFAAQFLLSFFGTKCIIGCLEYLLYLDLLNDTPRYVSSRVQPHPSPQTLRNWVVWGFVGEDERLASC